MLKIGQKDQRYYQKTDCDIGGSGLFFVVLGRVVPVADFGFEPTQVGFGTKRKRKGQREERAGSKRYPRIRARFKHEAQAETCKLTQPWYWCEAKLWVRFSFIEQTVCQR